MKSKQFGTRHLLRIDRGEEIVQAITDFLQEKNIRAGSISAIGAVDHALLRYYSLIDKEYHDKEVTGELEIASLTGNVSVMDGNIWPHLHIVLADTDFRCVGGHLASATVAVTCEVVIDALDGEVGRVFDEETGLKLWSL